MTTPERLTVRGPEDILGFIPHSLGYWPADSLVAMTLHGKQLGATLRLDLPGPDVLAAPGMFAATVGDYLQTDHQADGTLLVFFTNEGWRDGCIGAVQTYTGLLATLQDALAAGGMPVRDAWYVGDQYWRDAYCVDSDCCPLPGRSISEIRDSMLSTEMVFRGSSIGPAPEDSRPDGPVPGLHRVAVQEAEAEWLDHLESRRRSRAQFDAVLDHWASLINDCPLEMVHSLSVDSTAFMRATLQVPAWRDAVLVMAAAGRQAAECGAEEFGIFDDGPGLEPAVPHHPWLASTPTAENVVGRTASARQPLAGEPSRPVGDGQCTSPGYGQVLMGEEPAVPLWSSLDALDHVFKEVVPLGGPSAAAALTGRGWIAWCRGRGSYSAAYLGQALEIEPGYRLAELLLELVGRGTLCGWARRRDAAWQKFGTDAA